MVLVAACGTDTAPGGYAVDDNCRTSAPVSLAPGEYTLIDPRLNSGCVVIPGQAAASSYVGVVFSASGEEFSSGVTGDVTLSAGAPTMPSAAPAAVRASLQAAPARFHDNLRRREALLASRTSGIRRPPASSAADSVAVGAARTFTTCANYECSTYKDVRGIARFVGKSIAVYVDSLAPADGLNDGDLATLGALFDDQLFVIDTTAFGSPTDIDGNGRVIALLTVAVNQLVPNCNSQGIVLGYFNGTDLTPSEAGSNGGEVFYGILPDPANTQCTVSRDYVLRQLPRTFVHEFQHLINFGQHVVRRGGAPEQTWLNEGLSHYAEELAAKRVTDGAGGAPGSRYDEFAYTDLDNAYGYMLLPERYFVVVPSYSSGTPEERGAAWLFVRWLADQYPPEGGSEDAVTRRLLESTAVGEQNVTQATGQPFATLLAQWHLANYADDLPAIGAGSRLQYKSLQLRATYADLHQRDPGRFPRVYPSVPEVVGTTDYARSFTLRGGSGMLFRYDAPAAGSSYRLQLTGVDSAPLPQLAAPRVALLRLQ